MAMYREVLTGLGLEGYNTRRSLTYQGVARLKDDVTLEQARANADAIGKALERDFPTDNSGRTFGLLPVATKRVPATVPATVGALGQRRDGGRGTGPADCVRQCGEPAAGAGPSRRREIAVRCRLAPAAASRPATPHRERAARPARRPWRAPRGVLGASLALGVPAVLHPAQRGRPRLRRPGVDLRGAGLAGHRHSLRPCTGLPGITPRHGDRAQGADDAARRHALVQRAPSPRRRTSRALAGRARERGLVPAEPLERAADRPRGSNPTGS